MVTLYIWVDDIRPKPEDYDLWFESVWEFIRNFGINCSGYWNYVIDLDHDAGDYERFGGDYYNILKWLEWYYANDDFVRERITFKFHTANPVGKQNMINICERNNWKYEA